jgi:hypothetical protein
MEHGTYRVRSGSRTARTSASRQPDAGKDIYNLPAELSSFVGASTS